MASEGKVERQSRQLRVSEIDVEVSKRLAALAAARREGRSTENIRREVTKLTKERQALVYG